MIKFFRNIRKNLVNEDKTTKYFKYAIGEIVLVVIGILIALQLNNWNETQKEHRWEKQFLTDLRNELKSDLLQLQSVYEKQSAMANACQEVIELIQMGDKKNTAKIDSVYFITQNTNSTFFPTTGVYDSGLSAGKLENISADSLKYKIMNLYNHYYKRLIYNGELLDEVVLKINWEKIKYFDERTGKIRSWEHLLDFEFQGQVNFLMSQNKVYRWRVESSLKEIEALIEMISNELNK